MGVVLGFSYPKKFKIGAWLIAKWMGKPYSHVYLKFESNRIPNTIYHASHGMVHFMTEKNFLKDNNIIKEVRLPSDEIGRLVVLTHAMEISGIKYGYSELFKIVLTDICTYLKCPIFKTHNGTGYICSELLGEILEDLYNIKWNKPKHLLKPSDIEEVL